MKLHNKTWSGHTVEFKDHDDSTKFIDIIQWDNGAGFDLHAYDGGNDDDEHSGSNMLWVASMNYDMAWAVVEALRAFLVWDNESRNKFAANDDVEVVEEYRSPLDIAAPDLLAACKEMVERLDDGISITPDNKLFRAGVQLAIDKAEGKG